MAVVTLDDATGITYLNHAAELLLRASNEQSRPLKLADLLTLDDHLAQLLTTVLKTASQVHETDYCLRLPHEDMPLYVSLRLTPLFAAPQSRDVRGLMMIIEPPPRFANPHPFEMMERFGTMAAILNHEIKNPLAAIRAAAQYLASKLEPAAQGMTRLIGEEVERIRVIIDELEIFSNPERIKTEPVNIHQVLRTALEVCGEYLTNIRIAEEYDPSLPPAQANENLLLQALRNIIKNAAEAMENTPDATLTLSTQYQAGHYRQLADGGRESVPLTIYVADNGPGVPEDIRPRLFEPFVSRKAQGRGLGLSIVAKIISDHGGVLDYRPRKEVGSRFRIRLAVAK